MRSFNLNIKKFAAVGALGLMLIAGVTEAEAQGWGRLGKDQKKIMKQERKLEKRRVKLEERRLRLEERHQGTVYGRDRYRVYRDNGWYNTDTRGAEMLRRAVSEGYRQGFAAGRADRDRRRGADWDDPRVYRNGSYGGRGYVDEDIYQDYFREGFERGYEDGYNSGDRRPRYGTYNNGIVNILGSILNSILNLQRY